MAVAAGGWVARQHRPAAPPGASAPPAAAAASQPAINALMALPELKAWSEWIEKTTGGRSHGAVVAGDPAPRTIGGKTYLAYSFVENEPEAAHFWQGFYVTASGDSILVEDATSGETMSVEQWREKEHPLDRIKAHSPL
ncbi:MAG TPA: hypothetical protein VFF16_10255 [Telluria sp.]|nr:hypothetical protein [Telluria sp.]